MPWIRLDCSTLDDDFCLQLTGNEFKAWTLFLLRVKAMGARGRVKVTSHKTLAKLWNVPASAIASMIKKSNGRIHEENGTWYVKNWSKYQDDYRNTASPEQQSLQQDTRVEKKAISASTETSVNPIIPRNGATLPHPTSTSTKTKATATDTGAPDLTFNGTTLDQVLLTEWGDKGKPSHSVMLKLIDLKTRHGPERMLYAIQEAAKHDARNLAYVEGILRANGSKKKDTPMKAKMNCSYCHTEWWGPNDSKCPNCYGDKA